MIAGSPVVLAEIDATGARFAMGKDESIRSDTLWEVDAKSEATFTGALQSYAKRVGIALHGCSLAISAAGAVDGDVVKITTGRWFILKSGLRSVTGREPLILNYVAAAAWGAASAPASALRPVGTGTGAPGQGVRALLWVAGDDRCRPSTSVATARRGASGLPSAPSGMAITVASGRPASTSVASGRASSILIATLRPATAGAAAPVSNAAAAEAVRMALIIT